MRKFASRGRQAARRERKPGEPHGRLRDATSPRSDRRSRPQRWGGTTDAAHVQRVAARHRSEPSGERERTPVVMLMERRFFGQPYGRCPARPGRATRDASSDTLVCHPRRTSPSGRVTRTWYRAVGTLVTPSRTRPRLVKANEPDRPIVQCLSVCFSTTKDGRRERGKARTTLLRQPCTHRVDARTFERDPNTTGAYRPIPSGGWVILLSGDVV